MQESYLERTNDEKQSVAVVKKNSGFPLRQRARALQETPKGSWISLLKWVQARELAQKQGEREGVSPFSLV